MTSDALKRARDFEAEHGSRIPAAERPAFHATPTIGWMNDPNGFSLYRGEYHLFYQYHPYSNEWGPMHWGHLKSRDLLRWERLPAAIAPDEPYDAGGCFSGGAVGLPDGRQLLVYTGVRAERGADGRPLVRQTQCLAVGDGTDYEKYAQNPVLDDKDLPDGGSAVDFRDPKVWREADGSFRAVVGNRCADGSGAALLYRSADGFEWAFDRVLDSSKNELGRMWECPDFFPLDGRQILLVNPQDMTPVGLEFHAGNCTACLIGEFSERDGFRREIVQAVDYGIDFYAPQTLLAPDGRRIMIGWMQNWHTVLAKPSPCRWFGQMSLPRELSLRGGRLVQTPVRELERCRKDRVAHVGVAVGERTSLEGVRGRVLDMTVELRPGGERPLREFRLNVAEGCEFVTTVRFLPERSILCVDRSRSGLPYDVVHTREFFVRQRDGALKLRIVLDRFSMELFANDGEQAASFTLYTPQEADGISFEADGSAVINVEKYDLCFDEEADDEQF